jgi:deoxyribose-phosphate aldolase
MPTASSSLASLLEHTYLPPFPLPQGAALERELERLCHEAETHGFKAVCVRPEHVLWVRQRLGSRSPIALVGVVGFPEKKVSAEDQAAYPVLGAVNSTTKLQEIMTLASMGADEADVVLNVAFFKTDLEVEGTFTRQELEALRTAAGDMPLKLIIETDVLSDAEIVAATALCAATGMDYVKTCTGYVQQGRGATPQVVQLIQHTLVAHGAAEAVGIKASGGITTAAQALALAQAGATRLGSSKAPALCGA